MWVLANLPGKISAHRIPQDIQGLPRQRLLSPHCMIEVARLPYRTSTASQAIQGKRARRLHSARNA